MNNTDRDINVLRKLLSSEIFLGKYPFIDKVWVDRFGINSIDIVLGPSDAGDYWSYNNDMYLDIHNLAKMADVTTKYRIYP
jgi:hypothetical protein